MEFERECGSYTEYIKLLKSCLQINPTKRPTIKEILQHKFFSVYKDYIERVQNQPYQSVNEIEQGSQHDYILKDIQRFYEYGRDAAHIKRISNEENPHNHYLRTLVIASFLRISNNY
jgi:serine/threonine protein kinase